MKLSAKTKIPGTRPGMLPIGGRLERVSLEVIGRAHISGAFDRRFRGDSRKQRGVMVGAELVVPVAIANISVPDAWLAPENLRRIQTKTNVFEDFGLGFVVVQGARTHEAESAETAAGPDRV